MARVGTDGGAAARAARKAAVPMPRHLVRVDPDFNDEYPDANALSTEAFASLLVVGDLLGAHHERQIAATLGVSQPVAQALAILDGAGEALTPSQIRERQLVSSASMTAILDTLERRGWIRRTPNPEDRRSLLIEITKDGRATADRFIPGLHAAEAAILSVLTERERKQLLGLLLKVLEQANALAIEAPAALVGVRRRPNRLG